MKFVCDRCQTKYSIADERVRGKVLKVKCKTCANVITVREARRPSSAGHPTLTAGGASRSRTGAHAAAAGHAPPADAAADAAAGRRRTRARARAGAKADRTARAAFADWPRARRARLEVAAARRRSPGARRARGARRSVVDARDA